MYNRIFIKNDDQVFLDTSIFNYDIFEKNNRSSILELEIDYKNGGTLLNINDNNSIWGIKIYFYSFDEINCLLIDKFSIESTYLYNNTLSIKMNIWDMNDTDLTEIPELMNIYRDIKINKILNEI